METELAESVEKRTIGFVRKGHYERAQSGRGNIEVRFFDTQTTGDPNPED